MYLCTTIFQIVSSVEFSFSQTGSGRYTEAQTGSLRSMDAQTGSMCYRMHKLEVCATGCTNWKYVLQDAQTGSMCYRMHKLEVCATKRLILSCVSLYHNLPDCVFCRVLFFANWKWTLHRGTNWKFTFYGCTNWKYVLQDAQTGSMCYKKTYTELCIFVPQSSRLCLL